MKFLIMSKSKNSYQLEEANMYLVIELQHYILLQQNLQIKVFSMNYQ